MYLAPIINESIGDYLDRYREIAGKSIFRHDFVARYPNTFHIHFSGDWRTAYFWLTEMVDRNHYGWFGNDFYFQYEEDALKFRLACD